MKFKIHGIEFEGSGKEAVAIVKVMVGGVLGILILIAAIIWGPDVWPLIATIPKLLR